MPRHRNFYVTCHRGLCHDMSCHDIINVSQLKLLLMKLYSYFDLNMQNINLNISNINYDINNQHCSYLFVNFSHIHCIKFDQNEWISVHYYETYMT